MKTAILGTGSVGQTLATKLFDLGHEVMIGTRNVKEKLNQDAKNLNGSQSFSEWHHSHSGIKLGDYSEAARFGEILFNATQGVASVKSLSLAGASNLKGKIIVDIANPLDFSQGMPPSLIPELSNTWSLAEEIQKNFPESKVVKTLNTMWCGLMINPVMIGKGDHTNFICGNDVDAKAKVKDILLSFGWKEANILDLGDISNARGTEALLPIWLRVWQSTKNGAFNFRIIS